MARSRAASRAAPRISSPTISAPCMPAQNRGASTSAARMSPASRRASAMPAHASVPASSARSNATLRPPPSPTELLLHIRQRQLLQQRIDLALQRPRQLVQGEAYAVIGHPVLRDVVRADLGRAITRAHLRAPQA